jgi:type II secretory pathway predicted ATPase ExeA
MYERFYQLRERPFALSPDPEYLYPSRVHQEALDYLRYGLESHAGFVVITGEIGSGKTTLLQTVLRNLDTHTTVGRIVNTMLDPRELLETIMLDFGLEVAGRSKPQLLRDLAQYLVDQRLAGRMVLIVIDEAQNLSLAALEELRMLSNLETEKSKLLQIVLVGQTNLRDKLATPELEQLRQRITVSYHLAPLEFPREATTLVHGRSRGVPRIINIICDAALVFGYAEERPQIDRALVSDVLAELETTGVLPPGEAGPQPTAQAFTSAPSVPEREAAPAAVAQTFTSASEGEPAPGPVAQAFRPAAAVEPPHTARVLDARNWPPVQARSTTVSDDARSNALEQREQTLRQRERELAEQRRVLAEEYRLLRQQRHTPLTPTGTMGRAAARDESRRIGLWGRLKRIMLSVSP